jgi:Insertion element 4 transposase N-terminal/Transposase DDE domain
MARRPAGLPSGSRITDYISLGVIAKWFPRQAVDGVLSRTGKASKRQRNLPAHVMVYYTIALALFMQVSCGEVLRCLLEGLAWLSGPDKKAKVTGDSGISQARSRLGVEPVKQLHDEVVRPLAGPKTKGAWYRCWRLVSLDGSSLDVADEKRNREAFGYPGASRGASAFPQIRFVSLLENGTHILFASRMGPYATGEITLAKEVLPELKRGMLCMADRNFLGYELWKRASATGADLLWRCKSNLRLEPRRRLEDGSYLSHIYPSEKDWRRKTNGMELRFIEYQLEGIQDAEPFYRLATTILDPSLAPAVELASLYHERWEIEGALAELKTHLRGSTIVLRSKTPELVQQEFYGLMMAHFAIRGLMHEAALEADEDPDRLSYVHAVRVVRRKLPQAVSTPPSG